MHAGADPFVGTRKALSASSFSTLFQVRLYSRNKTGDVNGLLNITGNSVTTTKPIVLPYNSSDGSRAVLGEDPGGYPPSLYPNITYADLGRMNST